MQRVGWMEKGEQPNKQGKSAAAHTHANRRTTMNDTKCGQIGKDARIFSEEQGSTKPKATKLAFEREDSKRRNDLTLSHGFSPSNPTEHLHYKRRQTKTRKPQTRRAGQHRKSRSYCRTERLNCTKPVLGSQWSHKLRVLNAVPAQQGAPDGTLPPCGVRTFPPYRRLKCISDGKGKRGCKGWKTVGCPSLAFRSPSKGNLVESENVPVGRLPGRLWPTCSAKS